ncbi:Delta(7)-sterol 5(6)-desaturase-like protein [Cladobotryum mycophilum]|uniref:Delta(7)-sterol 5(6)-desaturase-like protein n=1 Tax=Cladobotryum mycophilum TaxID=491253 RepID=A0ABR0T4E0_9HYPO
MDVILDYLDPIILDSAYESTRQRILGGLCQSLAQPSHSSLLAKTAQKLEERICAIATDSNVWEQHSAARQCISVFVLIWPLSSFFYLLFGAICYYLNFDPAWRKDPKFHRTQIRSEIKDSLVALLWLNVLTVPIFWAQMNDYAKIYKFGSGSLWYEIAQYPFYVMFSDMGIYVIPTPFAAFAFDPFEAWIMSLPIYAYSFIWPMSDVGQIIILLWTNIWTMLLHDNRDQFHTVHHKNINLNFGQYLTLWDYLGGLIKTQQPSSGLVKA